MKVRKLLKLVEFKAFRGGKSIAGDLSDSCEFENIALWVI